MRSGHVVSTVVACALLAACGSNGPSSLAFSAVSPQQPKIGDVTTVTFVALDYRGLPAPGVSVNFQLLSPLTDGGVSGVTLSPASSLTNKGDGTVQTQLVATNRVNSVIVVATAGGKTAFSPPITFAGSFPSARNFTFQCGELDGTGSGGIHAIRAYDDVRSMIEGVKLKCNAHVADRNGDGISGVEVSFLAEAGTIEPTQTTTTDVDGNATVLYKTTFPLPVETTPGVFKFSPWAVSDSSHTGDSSHPIDYIAPLWMHPFEWVSDPLNNYSSMFQGPFDTRSEPARTDPLRPNQTNNPRDNLVTMIAVTTGEEVFNDNAGTGQFDPNKDDFIDGTEPFVDSNDNGTWDPGELYIDTNGDGQWTGKNGHYDPSTLIWAKERILWTGFPEYPLDYLPPQPCFKSVNSNGLVVPHCQEVGPVTALFTDPWFNSMAQDGNGDGCSLGAPSGSGGGGGFKPLVVADPTQFSTGVPTTYPPVTAVQFNVADNHDCSAGPDGGTIDPPFPPPGAVFGESIFCSQTASRENGDVLLLEIPNVVTGNVF